MAAGELHLLEKQAELRQRSPLSQPLLLCFQNCLASRGNVKLFVDLFDVGADSFIADKESFSDAVKVFTGNHQMENFFFPIA